MSGRSRADIHARRRDVHVRSPRAKRRDLTFAVYCAHSNHLGQRRREWNNRLVELPSVAGGGDDNDSACDGQSNLVGLLWVFFFTRQAEVYDLRRRKCGLKCTEVRKWIIGRGDATVHGDLHNWSSDSLRAPAAGKLRSDDSRDVRAMTRGVVMRRLVEQMVHLAHVCKRGVTCIDSRVDDRHRYNATAGPLAQCSCLRQSNLVAPGQIEWSSAGSRTRASLHC